MHGCKTAKSDILRSLEVYEVSKVSTYTPQASVSSHAGARLQSLKVCKVFKSMKSQKYDTHTPHVSGSSHTHTKQSVRSVWSSYLVLVSDLRDDAARNLRPAVLVRLSLLCLGSCQMTHPHTRGVYVTVKTPECLYVLGIQTGTTVHNPDVDIRIHL